MLGNFSLNMHLFTSIPPRLQRRLHRDFAQTAQYQRVCVSSWKAVGFAPVTINSARENLGALAKELDVELVSVPADASSVFGRPLVYWRDFVDAASSRTSGVMAITNADIVIRDGTNLSDTLTGLREDECLILHRVDVESLGARRGRLYTHGFDFFAFHASALGRIEFGELVFGLPWWDHWLPIALIECGLKPVLLREPPILHEIHAERWDPASWSALGEAFLRLIPSLERDSRLPSEQRFANYLSSLEILPPPPQVQGLVSRSATQQHDTLAALSQANLTWLAKHLSAQVSSASLPLEREGGVTPSR